jgi:hypothetical protein
MNSKNMFLLVLVVSVFCFLFTGCGTTRYMAEGNGSKPLYLKNNIHVQQRVDEYRGSYANWTEPSSGHVVIPVNTIVEIDYKRSYFVITDKDKGRKAEIEYDESNMGMNTEQYLKLITTTTPVALDHFSNIDRKGITDGKAYIGMSKDGIRVALGYPARHRTASLESNTWVYWRGRFGTRAIDFDSAGKVSGIK